MSVRLETLPPMIEFNDYGDWDRYIEVLYDVYKKDFVLHKCKFGANELRLKVHPKFQDRAYTFYHITHSGDVENERTPDLRRCERLPWARPTIENTENYNLKFWEQTRGRNHRVCIWLDVDNGDNYFCILDIRKEYVLMWTAFYAEHSHQVRKKQAEYEKWLEIQDREWTPDSLVADIQNRI